MIDIAQFLKIFGRFSLFHIIFGKKEGFRRFQIGVNWLLRILKTLTEHNEKIQSSNKNPFDHITIKLKVKSVRDVKKIMVLRGN